MVRALPQPTSLQHRFISSQIRDLAAWLLIALGLVDRGKMDNLLKTLSTLSSSVAMMMQEPSAESIERLRHLCSEIVSLLAILLHIPSVDPEDYEMDVTVCCELSFSRTLFDENAGVISQVENQITSILEAIKQLISEHSQDLEVTALSSFADSRGRSSTSALAAYKQLRGLIAVRALREEANWQRAVATLRTPACIEVLHALQRSFATTTPGSEPENGEAKRQLFFFINSMHNRWMPSPTSVRKMKSCTSLTPHYEEEVAYSADALQSVGDEGVNLEHLLKACAPSFHFSDFHFSPTA